MALKVPKTFKKLNEQERIKYAMKKKKDYEDKAQAWTIICRKLVSDKDFTPLEIDLIDCVLEKDIP